MYSKQSLPQALLMRDKIAYNDNAFTWPVTTLHPRLMVHSRCVENHVSSACWLVNVPSLGSHFRLQPSLLFVSDNNRADNQSGTDAHSCYRSNMIFNTK
jgi:hypothetical protein